MGFVTGGDVGIEMRYGIGRLGLDFSIGFL